MGLNGQTALPITSLRYFALIVDEFTQPRGRQLGVRPVESGTGAAMASAPSAAAGCPTSPEDAAIQE
jgi:hypothetical protein